MKIEINEYVMMFVKAIIFFIAIFAIFAMLLPFIGAVTWAEMIERLPMALAYVMSVIFGMIGIPLVLVLVISLIVMKFRYGSLEKADQKQQEEKEKKELEDKRKQLEEEWYKKNEDRLNQLHKELEEEKNRFIDEMMIRRDGENGET